MLNFSTPQHNKLLTVFAGLLLVSMAVLRVRTPEQYARFGFLLVMYWGVVFATGSLIFLKVDKWIGAFVISCLFYSIFPSLTFRSGYTLFAIFLGSVWYLFLTTENINPVGLLNGLAVIAIINSVLVLLQWSSGNTNFPMVGLMGNINEVSAILGVCLPSLFRRYWRCFIPMVLVGLVLSKSFGGLAAAGVSIIVYGFYHGYRFLPVVCVTGCVVAYYLFVDTPGIGARKINCLMGIEAWKAQPLGYGIGHWKPLFSQVFVGGKIPTTAHNEFVQLLVEAPLTLLLVGGFILSWINKTCHICYGIDPRSKVFAIPMAMFAGVIVSCCCHFFFHIATTALIGVTILAIMGGTYEGFCTPKSA